ncbi:MAG TPA: hypothetical protein VFJ85_04730 [Acidimicrobiales bacterium]|nr:hypothetical protein [Acidimicrobiales bacterium]
MTRTGYYRGADEPGGKGEIIAEVVDGTMRRRIELDGTGAHCTGYDEYPVNIDMDAIADDVREIDQEEFEAAWTQHCARRMR